MLYIYIIIYLQFYLKSWLMIVGIYNDCGYSKKLK